MSKSGKGQGIIGEDIMKTASLVVLTSLKVLNFSLVKSLSALFSVILSARTLNVFITQNVPSESDLRDLLFLNISLQTWFA